MGGGFDRKPRPSSKVGTTSLVQAVYGPKPAPTVPGKQTLTQMLPMQRSARSPARAPVDSDAVQHAAAQGVAGAGSPMPHADAIQQSFGRHDISGVQAHVQRRGDGDISADQVHAAAARGISTPTTSLPHADAIQASFGPTHDVSQIQAHVGGAATEACQGMGASAFATGSHVAFASTPDLHTAAHEAAHVVQQARGVNLYGGVGTEGDPYEQHADAVADRVVAGRSAEDLLDGHPGGGGGPAVQRKGGKDLNSKDYIAAHEGELAATAATQIEAYPFATGEPSAPWAAGGLKKFTTRLAAHVRSGDAPLRDIVQPEHLGILVDRSRVRNQQTFTDPADGEQKTQTTGFGPDRYVAGAGIAVANAIARRTNEALERQVPRYVQARLAAAGEPPLAELIAGHPIDPLVFASLAAGGVLAIDQTLFGKRHPELAGRAKAISPLPAGSLVQEKDPKRKQWYRLMRSEPAPAEQIALTLLGDSKQAYRIEVAHPLYGVKRWGDELIIDNLADDKQDSFIEEIGLDQAGTLGIAGSNPPAAVIAQIRMNALTVRTSVHDNASALGYGMLSDYSSKLTARADRLEKGQNDAETRRWDVHSRAQAAIIKQGAKGLEADRKRQRTYAAQFGGKDANNDAIPEQQRQALFDDASMWANAIETSDAVKTAEGMLQAAFRHSATLEMDVLEQQLSMPQAAADLPNQDKDSHASKDFNAASLGPREVELRKKLGLMRQQILTDPSKLDASADKASEESRKLVFESNVVMQAAQMDQAWRILDDTSGFWAWVTGDSGKINGLKKQGKGYYTQWQEVYADVQAKKIDVAQKKYEKLVANRSFQTFLGTVQQAVREAQAKQLLAKLIGMVVITIVSMGVGTIVEGLVGGATVVAGAVGAGAETATAVTAGLGWGRTATAVAGFIAETGTFTLASNLLMSKDHSVTAILTEFGKNVAMFGALRGVGKLLEVAFAGKLIKAAAAPAATDGVKLAGAAAKLATDVISGGAGVLAGYIEARITAAIKGQHLTEEQTHEMIKMNVAQAIIMVIVGRLMQSPMNQLKIAAAYKGTKWRLAETHAARIEALAKTYGEHPTMTEAQLHELIQKDLEQINLEKAAFEEVRAALEKRGKSTKALDDHLAELGKFGDASESALLLVGLKQQAPNHFLVPVTDIAALKTQQTKAGSTWEELPAKTGEPRTYKVTSATGDTFFVTEELPAWVQTPAGKRIMTVARKAGLGDLTTYGLTDGERAAIQQLERAVDAKDTAEAARAKAELGKLAEPQLKALEKAVERQPWDTPPEKSREFTPDKQVALDKELARRGLDGNAKFKANLASASGNTRNNVKNALGSDPMGTRDAVRAIAEKWAMDRSGGNPQDFANRYEFAKAKYSEAETAAKGKPNKKAEADKAITADLLDKAYGTDAAKVRALGEGGTVAGMPPDIREASAAQVKAIQDKVRTQGRYEMGSESGEVYHASKHYKELPPDLQKGDPVNNTAEVARATVKDGTIKKTWSEDGALKYVVHHTFKSKTAGAPDTVLEALMIVRADGKVVMATFGSPKLVPP